MTLKKLIVSGVAALTLSTTGVLAADNTETKVAKDGTGDYLIFPYYAATGTWETNLRVINTNPTDAIVAKVVFREYKQSAEVLDFPIYLTPGDVWEGKIKLEDGKVILYSNDDSLVLADYPELEKKLVLNDKRGGKNPAFGYVEIFGVAQIPAINVDPTFQEKEPLDKAKLVSKFKTELNGRGNASSAWKGVDADSLYGEEILYENENKLAMTLPATALEGVTGEQVNDSKVTGTDTTFAEMIRPLGDAGRVINQMVEALSKTRIYTSFYDGGDNTVLVLTQPFAKYKYNVDHVVESGFFYSSLARDMQENSSFYKAPETDISGQDAPPPQREGCWYADSDYTRGVNGDGSSLNTNNAHGHEICFINVKEKVGNFKDGYVEFTLEQPRAIIPTLMTVKKVGNTLITNIINTPYK
jgi:hypothetical protein